MSDKSQTLIAALEADGDTTCSKLLNDTAKNLTLGDLESMMEDTSNASDMDDATMASLSRYFHCRKKAGKHIFPWPELEWVDDASPNDNMAGGWW